MDSQHQPLNTISVSSLAQLGQAIKENAERIQAHLEQNNKANPTFSLGSSPRMELPADIEGIRQQLFDDMEHLTALLRGPLGHVINGGNPVTLGFTVTLAAISKFRIAEHVSLDGSPISIDALATACHLDQSDLLPLLRTAIANRTFEAVNTSEIRHNAASNLIATMPDLRHWLEHARMDFIPAAFALPEAIAKWPGASGPEQSAFALAMPEHLPMFEAMKNDPSHAERFAGTMRLLGGAGAAEVPRVVEALELQNLPDGATIVDIGGSTGDVLIKVLRRYTQLRGIVQDLPTVVAKAQVPDDLTDRLSFQAADFFEEEPEKGATIYFLRKILHDWSDEYSRKLLRKLVPALKIGARIVLNELCLSPLGSIHPRREQNQRGWDLAMKWLLNGRERDEGEWKALFHSVDKRFKFSHVRSVPAGSSSLIEFSWQE